MLRVDWTRHFQPAPGAKGKEPKDPVPCVFESREHAEAIYTLRVDLGQKLFVKGDRHLPDVHERVGYMGDDRRQNGTDKPSELSPFGDVIDDEDEPTGLEGWTLKKELAAWREAAQPQASTRKEAA